MIGIGVVGYGYWGPNLVRNFFRTAGARVVMVCDQRTERREAVQALYPTVRTCEEVDALFADPDVQAVCLATPVGTHFELAMKALNAGRHVFVEKPLTTSSEQARTLINEAEGRHLVLMVDHTFVYTAVVRKIKQLIDQRYLGRLYYYDSVRVNLGLFQPDVNVLWDLAAHDVSIMDYLLGQSPRVVAATGTGVVPGQPESLAYLSCRFDDGLMAHFHVNWLSPVKIRQTLIGGSDKMVSWDDMQLTEKLRVYDRGITLNSSPENLYELKVGYRAGDMWAPHVPNVEAPEGFESAVRPFLRSLEEVTSKGT